MPWLGTFHSIGGQASCAAMPSWCSCAPNFTILDTDDQIA
jgi:hypothetical protein